MAGTPHTRLRRHTHTYFDLPMFYAFPARMLSIVGVGASIHDGDGCCAQTFIRSFIPPTSFIAPREEGREGGGFQSMISSAANVSSHPNSTLALLSFPMHTPLPLDLSFAHTPFLLTGSSLALLIYRLFLPFKKLMRKCLLLTIRSFFDTSMVSPNEVAEEYRAALSELTRNDKTQINLLTILAEDYASYAGEIVEVIEGRLFKCSSAMKIVMLYVLDSIVKNIPSANGAYRDLFAKKIVDMIVHVFKESDEKTRASIYRLRCTWGDVFPRSRLYMIDIKINAIDKAWPIIHPSTPGGAAPPQQPPPSSAGGGGSFVHVNPLFLNGKSPTTATAAVDQQQKTKQQKTTSAAKLAVAGVKKEPDASSTGKEELVSSTTSEPSVGGLVVTVENKMASKVVKTDRERQQPRKREERTKDGTKKEGDGGKPKKDQQQQKRKPESLMSLKVKPPPLMQQQQQQGGQPPPKRLRRTMTQSQSSTNIQQVPTTLQPTPHQPPVKPQTIAKTLNKTAEPTTALGAHAFGRTVMAQHTPPTTCVTSPAQTTENAPPAMNPRAPLLAVPPSVVTSMAPIVVPSVANQPPVQNVAFIDQTPPQFFPRGPTQQQQHHIQNVTPRLPGVPENNRIFVDGKAYEVFYLDDVAVIERNGLPHRVSFAGPARDVIIDGTAHRMSFGEHKQVLIDGDVHILRFGAPSREMYMGNFAFKGAFGGPPIIATINQRRHEIRLCGPPPEVRIDPEPSYELMRYMPTVRQQQPMMQPKTEAPSIDVSKLLKRLKETGLLAQQPTEAERKQRERQAAMEAKNAAIASLNAAPIPSNHRLDNIERRPTPVSGLEQFSMRSLIIRYDSVIDAIHRPRVVCQYCGIAFQELYNEAYQRHADWHLQNTIRMEDQKLNKGPKVVKGIRSQPWYMVEEWFDYSETELVNRTQGAGGQDGADKSALAADDEKEAATTASVHHHAAGTNRDAPSETVESKECQVCHEQFEEYWDEEEDVWRLRSCVLSDGKAFHTFCREDVVPEEPGQTLRIKDTPISDCV
uniref:CID domain-containing protein n=1 Tax=Globodera rostochiensis TaxID=31243 RepID=A0A914GW81_GLORO